MFRLQAITQGKYDETMILIDEMTGFQYLFAVLTVYVCGCSSFDSFDDGKLGDVMIGQVIN
ncbi:hypothetical protein C5167_026696 [Papaver somniferum]|nr:hypothetical protein C5167_026696 [Papaver somniferum]